MAYHCKQTTMKENGYKYRPVCVQFTNTLFPVTDELSSPTTASSSLKVTRLGLLKGNSQFPPSHSVVSPRGQIPVSTAAPGPWLLSHLMGRKRLPSFFFFCFLPAGLLTLMQWEPERGYLQRGGGCGVCVSLSLCLKDTPARWSKAAIPTLMGTNVTSDITNSGSHSFLFFSRGTISQTEIGWAVNVTTLWAAAHDQIACRADPCLCPDTAPVIDVPHLS